jgi:hypothetical protein
MSGTIVHLESVVGDDLFRGSMLMHAGGLNRIHAGEGERQDLTFAPARALLDRG